MLTDHVAYPGCYCADCVGGTPHERHTDHRGYIVGNGDRTKWRAWINGLPAWVDDPAEATRYGFRSDANAVHAEDEDAWCVVKYEDVATPSARITGDKDRSVQSRAPTDLTTRIQSFAKALETGFDFNVVKHLDALMCCDGWMCGCQGSTVGQYLAHHLRNELAPENPHD